MLPADDRHNEKVSLCGIRLRAERECVLAALDKTPRIKVARVLT